MICVAIRDTGVSMDDETLESVFHIGKKGISNFGTQNESGTGLGLILCEEFAKAVGGKIGVASELGTGSRFWFTIPTGNEQPVVSLEDELQSLEKLSHMKLLIAEDNPLSLEASSVTLKDLNLDNPPLIFALTSHSKKEINEMEQQVHFDGFLSKPLDKEQLW